MHAPLLSRSPGGQTPFLLVLLGHCALTLMVTTATITARSPPPKTLGIICGVGGAALVETHLISTPLLKNITLVQEAPFFSLQVRVSTREAPELYRLRFTFRDLFAKQLINHTTNFTTKALSKSIGVTRA